MFVEYNGHPALTGAGLMVAMFLFVLVIVLLWEFFRKVLFYQAEYKRMSKELEVVEFELEKFPADLERYYQKRKQWEKQNGFW